MTPHEHLQMLINRAYFEDEGAYRALMAQRDAEIQHCEKEIKFDYEEGRRRGSLMKHLADR